jgi:hypothetical protein
VSWESISLVAGSPAGPTVAYSISRTDSIPNSDDFSVTTGTLAVEDTSKSDDAGTGREEGYAIVSPIAFTDKPLFGLINTTDYYFFRQRNLPDGGLAGMEMVIRKQDQEQVVHDHLSGLSDVGVFARGQHLYFAGTDDSGPGVWSVDLTLPTLSAQRISLYLGDKETLVALRPTGAIPKALRRSEHLVGVDFSDEPVWDSPEQELLLVSIRPREGQAGCEHVLSCARWMVVDFATGKTTSLDVSWTAKVFWAPDGKGLFALDHGLYWLSGPSYRDRDRLSDSEDDLFIPTHWPVP